jgi:hypothetical protein
MLEKKITAEVTFKVLSVVGNAVRVRIETTAERGVAMESQNMVLLVGESFTLKNLRLTVSGA